MSFKPSIPRSLLLDGEHNVESHFSAVNYQVRCEVLMSTVAIIFFSCLIFLLMLLFS